MLSSWLLVLSIVGLSSSSSTVQRCSFGDAHPPTSRTTDVGDDSDNLGCAPPARVGAVSVTVDLNETEANGRYLQASVLSYTNPSPVELVDDPLGASTAAARGQQVNVAMLALGADEGSTLETARAYLEAAGAHGADLAILPEIFNNKEIPVNLSSANSSVCPNPEPLDGPTIQWVREIAKKHSMYVVAPICELADGRRWNSAVLIGRDGVVLGAYHKAFPVYGCPDPEEASGRCESFAGEQGVAPGWDGVGVYSLDFGRVSMLTCFDINFPELWHEAYALGAQLVIWPSAMNSYTDPSAPSYARLHQYLLHPCILLRNAETYIGILYCFEC